MVIGTDYVGLRRFEFFVVPCAWSRNGRLVCHSRSKWHAVEVM